MSLCWLYKEQDQIGLEMSASKVRYALKQDQELIVQKSKVTNWFLEILSGLIRQGLFSSGLER